MGVGRGSDKGVCPTRALVLATPREVRAQVWDFPNGCKHAFDVSVCRERIGKEDCDWASHGCSLQGESPPE